MDIGAPLPSNIPEEARTGYDSPPVAIFKFQTAETCQSDLTNYICDGLWLDLDPRKHITAEQ